MSENRNSAIFFIHGYVRTKNYIDPLIWNEVTYSPECHKV